VILHNSFIYVLSYYWHRYGTKWSLVCWFDAKKLRTHSVIKSYIIYRRHWKVYV